MIIIPVVMDIMNQNIPIHLLKALTVVSESNSLLEAATLLGITQPGLSKQLQLLETLLPHKVFVIEGKRKCLTPFGIELVNQVKAKMEGLDFVVHQTCERFSKPEDSTVKIIGRVGVLDLFSAKLKFPGRLIFTDAANSEVIKAVLTQKAEIGITYLEYDSLDIISKPLYKEKFKLIVPKKFLSESPSNLKKAFEKLKAYPCLTYKDPDELFNIILSKFNLETSELDIMRTTANFESIIAMTNNGMGWSIVPRHFIINQSNVYSLDIPSSLHPTRQFYLYFRKEMARASWLKQLRLEIEQCFKILE